MEKLSKTAPISKAERAQLQRDAADLFGAAKRKGVTLDRYEEAKEKSVASKHFELGCWLFRFTKLRGLPPAQYLSERVDLVTRIFLAGFNNPGYSFFTVFDFGERQFDGIFEEGDSQEVIEGLRRNIPLDTTGMLVAAFEYFGWPLTSVAPQRDTTERQSDAFNYQLLARLKQDCEYYLGHGNRAKKHLWAGDEAGQIAKMKELYAEFSEKPEWISLEDIAQYEAKMVAERQLG